MSKLEQISAFVAVIEENGFAAAAKVKGVSAAAISRQVTALENNLGAQLLRRTTRQLALTEIGEKYYQQCKKTLVELSDMEIAIAESSNEATGILTIQANRYFAVRKLLPRLPEFMHLNPKLRINFQLAERFPNLSKEGIDILFGVSIEGPSELIRRRVATTRYILCASPNYLKKFGIPLTPTDLLKHHYITHSIRKPDNIISFKDDKEIQVDPILWLNDSFAMRECAIRDMGIINLHEYMITDAIKEGKLVAILTDYQPAKKSVYLYYQQNRYLQPKIRRFIDFYTSQPTT